MTHLRRILFSTASFGVMAAAALLPAAASEVDENLLKTMFLEATTRFVSWPDSSIQPAARFSDTANPFILGVAGNADIVSVMKDFFAKATIKHKKVDVRVVAVDSSMLQCHMLFIPSRQMHRLSDIIALTANRPVLTVADAPGFAEKGVIINLFIEDNDGSKVRFKINKTSALSSGLKISYLLFKMGITVYTDGATK